MFIDTLISIVFWVWVILITTFFTIIVGLTTLLTMPFDKSRRIPHALTAYWGRTVFWANPKWKLKITGKNNLPKKGPYVLVSNHASLADIVVLFHLDPHFKWMAKESLFRIPLLGWSLLWAGDIPLLRGNQSSIRATYLRALNCLKSGIPVMIFPEGTRSRSGRLGPFKRGAFQLAIKAQVPIVPIVLHGTRDTIPPENWIFKSSARAIIQILPAVSVPKESIPDGDEKLRREIREHIADELEKKRNT